MRRRRWSWQSLTLGAALGAGLAPAWARAAGLAAAAAEPELSDGDPFGPLQWPELRKECLGA